MTNVGKVKIGDVFGRLTIIDGPIDRSSGVGISGRGKYVYLRKRKVFVCKCQCGKVRDFDAYRLLRGEVRSCGCLKDEFYRGLRKHNTSKGDHKKSIYKTWLGMIRRCHSTSASNYGIYGARGISVCNTWREDYRAFEKWSIENGYKKGLQIDRIDVDGNYSPENCRWVTPLQNARNRRNNTKIEYQGEIRRIVDIMSDAGCTIDARTVWKRIVVHGWDVDRALSEPKHYASRMSGQIK